MSQQKTLDWKTAKNKKEAEEKLGTEINCSKSNMERGEEKQQHGEKQHQHHQKQQQQRLQYLVLDWAELMSQTGSIHGLSWFSYFDSYILKGIVLVFALLCIGTVPCFVFVKMNAFLADNSILTKVATSKQGQVTFPKVTVCNPFYFNGSTIFKLTGGSLFF